MELEEEVSWGHSESTFADAYKRKGSSTFIPGVEPYKKSGYLSFGRSNNQCVPALEVSMTAVLTGPEKKLGLKCDWTVFNQVILDPELIESVPKDWWFYTGMDTYIHCIESCTTGSAITRLVLPMATRLYIFAGEIYLNDDAGQNAANNEKLMVASLMGGLSPTLQRSWRLPCKLVMDYLGNIGYTSLFR